MTEYWEGKKPSSTSDPVSDPAVDESPTPTSATATSGPSATSSTSSTSSSTSSAAGSSTKEAAKGESERVLSEASSQARNLMDQSRTQAQEQADTQRQRAASNLRKLGDDLGSMAGSGDQSGIGAQLVQQASEQVQQAASWLDSRDPQGILDDVRSFARRRPGVFLLGAAAAGLLAGRLTRAGVDVARDQRSSDQAPAPTAANPDPELYQTTSPTAVAPGPVATGVGPYPGEDRSGDDFADPGGPPR